MTEALTQPDQPVPVRQASTGPTRKVWAGGGIGYGITTVLVWALRQFYSVDMPPEIALIIGGILTFFIQWAIPPSWRDRIVEQ